MEVVVAVVLDMVLTGVVVDGRNCGWKAVRESYFLQYHWIWETTTNVRIGNHNWQVGRCI